MSDPCGTSTSATPSRTVIGTSGRLRTQALSTADPLKSSTNPQADAVGLAGAVALTEGRAAGAPEGRNSRTATGIPTARTTTIKAAMSTRTRCLRRGAGDPVPSPGDNAGAGTGIAAGGFGATVGVVGATGGAGAVTNSVRRAAPRATLCSGSGSTTTGRSNASLTSD